MNRFTISLIIIGFMFAHVSIAEVDPGSIVGAWLFDETGGKIAKDSSDNGNDGDLVGGAKWVKGKFGNAIELNGKDAWVTVPEIGPLDDFTLMKWFNATGRVGLWRCFFNRDGWAAWVCPLSIPSRQQDGNGYPLQQPSPTPGVAEFRFHGGQRHLG